MHLNRAHSAPAGLPDIHECATGNYAPYTHTVAVLTDYGEVEYPVALMQNHAFEYKRRCTLCHLR
jgi:hypothetical protein